MEQNIKEHSKIIKLTELEFLLGQIKENTKEIGKIINYMEMEK